MIRSRVFLLRGFAWIVRPINEPLFHPQEIQHLVAIPGNRVRQIPVVFGERFHRRHFLEHHPGDLSGHLPERIDRLLASPVPGDQFDDLLTS